MIGNYDISPEQAGNIPGYFHPQLAESDLPEGLRVKERYDERPIPMIAFHVDPNSVAQVHLSEMVPLVTRIDLISHSSREDFFAAKKRLEDSFRVKLEGIEK